MRRGFWLPVVFLALVLFTNVVYAADFDVAISNSEKWTDVFSVVHYANLLDGQSRFLVSPQHGIITLNELNKGQKIQVLSSESNPYVFNYESLVESNGFEFYGEITADNLNTELVNELDDIKNFIVVGDSFGYNALAVTPYAIKTKAWVFLANENNIFEIDSILSERDIDNILIYGFVDSQVTNVLSKYDPEIINTGDRFNDNIEIVEKYLKVNPMNQTILTNGEFIEKEIMSGNEPVLFTGKENVPEQIQTWLKDSPISTGVLIGNDLVGAATNIRQSTGISVLVKFARNARGQAGGISAVEALDLFPVPSPNMILSIDSANYNTALSQLEITYHSESNIPVYARGTITVLNGGDNNRVGDLEPIFIAPGDYKTISYPLEITDPNDDMTAEISTLYGETPTSLEKILDATLKINLIDVIDSCRISNENIKSVRYNKQDQAIFVKIKNNLDTDCWYDSEITGLKVGVSKLTVGFVGSKKISAGNTDKLRIDQRLTDSDIETNRFVNLVVYSGERENSLVHVFKGSFQLKVDFFTLLTYAIVLVFSLIVGLVFLVIFLRKKRKKYY